jgi:hypothetical protein
LIGYSKHVGRFVLGGIVAACVALGGARDAAAQTALPAITRVDLSVGRSSRFRHLPHHQDLGREPRGRDAVVIGERDVVLNGKALGETDVLLFTAGGATRQYRVAVHTPAIAPRWCSR